MDTIRFSTYGHSPALVFARNALVGWGYTVCQQIEEATHILLPVPSFDEDGQVKGSGHLPEIGCDVTVMGGNLQNLDCNKVDFLQDPYYLEENAAITAKCALHYADLRHGTRVLVIGWGRIGKHLTRLLTALGTDVTVAVRKERDWQALTGMGHRAVYLMDLKPREFDVVFNTAPASILFSGECREDAVLIDLASVKGIFGKGVIYARGLPSKDAPEESGQLIAKTALRYALGKELEV